MSLRLVRLTGVLKHRCDENKKTDEKETKGRLAVEEAISEGKKQDQVLAALLSEVFIYSQSCICPKQKSVNARNAAKV
jgi:hypothetical protein